MRQIGLHQNCFDDNKGEWLAVNYGLFISVSEGFEKLHKDDIYRMLISSENGFDDIISTRSKIIKENNINIDDMTVNQLMDFIIANPTILKRPIIVSDLELQVGYNEDDITLFLPPELRQCSCCFPIEDGCEYVTNIDFE